MVKAERAVKNADFTQFSTVGKGQPHRTFLWARYKGQSLPVRDFWSYQSSGCISPGTFGVGRCWVCVVVWGRMFTPAN